MSLGETRVASKTRAGESEQRHIPLLLWACLFLLVVADGLLTEFLVSQRLAWESNPFLVDWVGNSGFMALKAFGAVLAVLILKDIFKRNRRIALTYTCFFVLVYTLIIFWNVSVFFLEL